MYERFRTEIITKLCANFSADQLRQIGTALDSAAQHYTINPAENALATVQDTVGELMRTYFAVKSIEGLSEKTLQNYKYTLDSLFLSVMKSPEDITANDVRLYLANYQKINNISLVSLDNKRQIIARFFSWAASEGYISEDPTRGIKRIKSEKKQRHALSQKDFERLRRACQTKRETAIIEVLFSTGCRVSELAGLYVTDINEDGSVHVFGKGKKHRKSYLTAKALLAVEDYLAERKDGNCYLIVSDRKPHNKLSTRAIENEVARIAERAGVRDVTPHVIRHTTATIALANGMSVTEVQKLLGHASVNTTMIYAEQSDTAVKSAHSRCLA